MPQLAVFPRGVPSSRLLVGLVLALGLVPFAASVEGAYDLWWQLRTGQLILASGEIPRVGAFSFVSAGLPWINHEWLSTVLFAAVWNSAGAVGLVVLRFSLLAVTAVCAWDLLRKASDGRGYLAALWCAVCLTPLVGWFFNLRPQSMSILLFVVEFWILELYRSGRAKLIWLLPALFLLWVNLHAGFLIGGLLAGCALLPELRGVADRSGERSASRVTVLTVLLVTLLATLVQPYGLELFSYIIRELSSSHRYITEWRGIQGAQWLFIALLGALPLVLALRGRTTLRWEILLFHCILVFAVVAHGRLLPFLVLSASVVLFVSLRTTSKDEIANTSSCAPCSMERPLPTSALLLVLFFLALPSLMRLCLYGPRLVDGGLGLPKAAVGFLAREQSGSRLLLPLHWGGFAIYHLWPKYRVAIDGRNVTAYSDRYVEDYNHAYVNDDAAQLLALAPADVALLPRKKLLAQRLAEIPGWVIVYDDGSVVVLVRRQGYNNTSTRTDSKA